MNSIRNQLSSNGFTCLNGGLFGFRIQLLNNYMLSVACPPDLPNDVFETALFLNGHIHYNDQLGYSDIDRFSKDNAYNAIVQEINRLNKLIPHLIDEESEHDDS